MAKRTRENITIETALEGCNPELAGAITLTADAATAAGTSIIIDNINPLHITVADVNRLNAIVEPLLVAGYICEWQRSTIRIDGYNPDGLVRTPNQTNATNVDRLLAAWCMNEYFRHSSYMPAWADDLWRHALDCETLDAHVTVEGTASDGACETCWHEYDAAVFWINCGCGLIRMGTASNPYDITSPDGGAWQLPDVLEQLADLTKRYLNTTPAVPYPLWIPGTSRKPKTPTKTARQPQTV